MEQVDLVALVVSTSTILAGAWVVVRLLTPFAEALAERLRPKPLVNGDSLHHELDALRERVAELERREPVRALGEGPMQITSTGEG